MSEHTQLDLASVQARLGSATGPAYWRSLEELANTEAFQEFLHREFPSQAAEFTDPVGRRQFLRLMGASLALAGVSACTKQPPEKIVPYVRAPEEIVPGRPLFFATAVPLGGVAAGVLVESHTGRPTKIEGNPEHPASLGATDLFSQAAILGLYDPDRSQTVTQLGDIRSWGRFLEALRGAVEAKRGSKGAGLRILTETVTSPTLAMQLRGILEAFPAARWHQFEPAGRDFVRAGARLAFGTDVSTRYAFDKAKVVLSIDGDFLSTGPGALRYIRDFMDGRRVRGTEAASNRLYVVESTPSNTGAKADHRLPLRPSEVGVFARALAAEVGVPGVTATLSAPAAQAWLAAAARDLAAHKGASAVVVGDYQPPAVHALGHAINQALGNSGATVIYADPVEASPVDEHASLRSLVEDINAGTVDLLLVLGGNPVYSAPAELHVGEALAKVAFTAHLAQHEDETSARCQWHIPEAHVLEAWSDGRAWDGTASIVQPLIAPLYGGKSAHEVLAALSTNAGRPAYDLVQDSWKAWAAQAGIADFEGFWRRSVHDGVVAGTAFAPRAMAVGDIASAIGPAPRVADGLEVLFRPDPTVHDGRFANNGWLQEVPKPFTKLTWDNTIQLSPGTAARLGVANEDVVELRAGGAAVSGPAWIVPGQADDTVTVHLGYGRVRAGRVANGVGFSVAAIRTVASPWAAAGASIAPTGLRSPLACTQLHHNMEGRALVRSTTVEEYERDPHAVQKEDPEPPRTMTMYKKHDYTGYAWGMSVDLNSCVGCNACTVACQAENNVAVVGKDQVARGREMHWLRLDTYYAGGVENPDTYFQPVMCQQCENAPCEVVCPVGATVHSDEGLNDMVYNRCVGTRYCSNNCPYKVRRFNFYLYQDWDTPSLKLGRNPDVTVRSRGVMEKCTYCVQRINGAKIAAEEDGRQVRDGEIVTACEAACPARAIVFGNINDPESRVAKLRSEALQYALLGELNTRPRTTYLAAVKNPNPELAPGPAGGEHRQDG